jgi:hypothetical protein
MDFLKVAGCFCKMKGDKNKKPCKSGEKVI